jgi:hypothetical protein
MLEIEILSERIEELETEVNTLRYQLALQNKAKKAIKEASFNLGLVAYTGVVFLLFILGFNYEGDRVRYSSENTLNLVLAMLTSGTGIYALNNYRDKNRANQATIDETQSYLEAIR